MTAFTGYPIELENREELERTQTSPSRLLMLGDLPDRVDPRKSALARDGWLRVENQGQIGSCQGASLTECLEYCYAVATGNVIQLSKMYAYLRSQQFDRITGDRGSTLSGGSKAAQEGICKDSTGPYPRSYPGHSWITERMREEAKNFRLRTHTKMTSAENIKQFIGSGIGIVQIGISWGSEMTPDRNGCIRNFTGRGGGGHAVVLCGYVPDSDVGQQSSSGYWFLLKNSWDVRWGIRGYAYVDTSAVDRMLRHQFTVMYGRSDMETPDVRTLPHDFTKEPIYV